ncbi:MAG TPA: DNA-processing protein DprA [Fimbriimonadales bacterium]|nr:DNA-processing protein DprA [Fimbriimonadales bacterium]
MNSFDSTFDLELALCLTPEIGSASVSKILAKNALLGVQPEEFLRLREENLIKEYGLRESAAKAISNHDFLERVENFKKKVRGKNVVLTTQRSPIYPRRLEGFCQPPPVYVFLYGNYAALEGKTFCVLASRDASEEELAKVEKSVEAGVLEPMNLVSGANTNVYRRAAVVPLRWGAPRILVLDRGLFAALGDGLDREPFTAARLWRYRFDPSVDLVVSPFRPDDKYAPINNRKRDECVVGLSDVVRWVYLRPGGNMEGLIDRARNVGKIVEGVG